MDDKEHSWHDFHREDRLILSLWFLRIMLWVVLILLAAVATRAFAGPIAEGAGDNGAKITLYNDPCKLKEVSNLELRATWQEKGKVFEGCFGIHPYGVVLAYFSDKTVVIIPVDIFREVKGA